MNKETLIALFKHVALWYRVEIAYGDYPYAAYYSREDHVQREWAGYWFAYEPCKGATHTVYLPFSESTEITVIGLMHELGHIVNDASTHPTPNAKFDEEVEAWCTGITLARGLSPTISGDAYIEDARTSLTSYLDPNADGPSRLLHAIQHISGVARSNGFLV